jgi:hypothetical protein
LKIAEIFFYIQQQSQQQQKKPPAIAVIDKFWYKMVATSSQAI